MRFKIKIITLSWILCVAFSSHASEWQLSKDDSQAGIQVFTRVVDGSPLKEFKGVTQISASLSAAVALVNDHTAGPSWLHDCKELVTLARPNNTESEFYLVTAAPWPVKDRDSTIYSKLVQDPESLVVHISMQAKSGLKAEQRGRVRITQMQGYWQFKPVATNVTEVTYQVHANPAGSLPKWLINSLVVDMPYHTLKNMQTKVLSQSYQAVQLDFVQNFQ